MYMKNMSFFKKLMLFSTIFIEPIYAMGTEESIALQFEAAGPKGLMQNLNSLGTWFMGTSLGAAVVGHVAQGMQPAPSDGEIGARALAEGGKQGFLGLFSPNSFLFSPLGFLYKVIGFPVTVFETTVSKYDELKSSAEPGFLIECIEGLKVFVKSHVVLCAITGFVLTLSLIYYYYQKIYKPMENIKNLKTSAMYFGSAGFLTSFFLGTSYAALLSYGYTNEEAYYMIFGVLLVFGCAFSGSLLFLDKKKKPKPKGYFSSFLR